MGPYACVAGRVATDIDHIIPIGVGGDDSLAKRAALVRPLQPGWR
jgi:hypothetical protein